MKRILVIGASGQVGNAIYSELKRKHKYQALVIGTYCTNPFSGGIYLDLSDRRSIYKALETVRPNIVYLCSAYTAVDRCEEDELSEIVNLDAPYYLARQAKAFNFKLIYFSSSYVFDGNLLENGYKETDTPNPLNTYGRQKLNAEREILHNAPAPIVIRTIGVFGRDFSRKNFVYQVVDNLSAGKRIFVPSDQYINPINCSNLAKYSIGLVDLNKSGIFNIAGLEIITKSDFAELIAYTFNLDVNLITPIPTSEMNSKALRPVNGCLSTEKIGSVFPNYRQIILAQSIKEMVNVV